MRESSVEAKLHRGVLLQGGLSFKLAPTARGLPDRLVILPGGRIYLVELKQTQGRLRPDQRALHAKLAKRGVHVYTLNGPAEVDAWLTERNR